MAKKDKAAPNKSKSAVIRTFGNRLKHLRKTRYNTAALFANELGLEDATYRTYERGEAQPSFDTLARICQLLDTSLDYLILGKIEPR